jgi:putative SOS response-associated peptidase YedK
MKNFWQARKQDRYLIQAVQFIEWHKRGGKVTDPCMFRNRWFLNWFDKGEDLLKTINEALNFIKDKCK